MITTRPTAETMPMLRSILLALALLAGSAQALAYDYRLPTTGPFPYAKVTPVYSSATLCATWIDDGVCDLKEGRTYKLHRFTADWQGYTTRITVGGLESEELTRLRQYNANLRRLLDECRRGG